MLKLHEWVLNPFSACGKWSSLSSIEYENLIDITSDSTLKSTYSRNVFIEFWLNLKNFDDLSKKAITILLRHVTTYARQDFQPIRILKPNTEIVLIKNQTSISSNHKLNQILLNFPKKAATKIALIINFSFLKQYFFFFNSNYKIVTCYLYYIGNQWKLVFIFITFLMIFTEGHLIKFELTKGHCWLKSLETAVLDWYL